MITRCGLLRGPHCVIFLKWKWCIEISFAHIRLSTFCYLYYMLFYKISHTSMFLAFQRSKSVHKKMCAQNWARLRSAMSILNRPLWNWVLSKDLGHIWWKSPFRLANYKRAVLYNNVESFWQFRWEKMFFLYQCTCITESSRYAQKMYSEVKLDFKSIIIIWFWIREKGTLYRDIWRNHVNCK